MSRSRIGIWIRKSRPKKAARQSNSKNNKFSPNNNSSNKVLLTANRLCLSNRPRIRNLLSKISKSRSSSSSNSQRANLKGSPKNTTKMKRKGTVKCQ